MTLERTKRPLDFIVSRFSRLFPTYWAAILITTLVVHVGGLTDQQIPLRAVLENAPMIQAGILNVPMVDGCYWTLAVELCFYGLMLALFLMKRLGNIEPLLFGWIACKWLWAAHVGTHQLSWIVGVALGQQWAPFFTIGVVAYRLFTRSTSWVQAATLLLFAIVTEFCLDGAEMGVVAVLVTAVFLLFVSGYATALRWRVFTWLGSISYPLYVLHENVGRTVIRAIERHGFGESIAVPVAIVNALVLATIVSYLVERPARDWIRGWYRGHSRRLPAPSGGVPIPPSLGAGKPARTVLERSCIRAAARSGMR